VTTTPLQKKPRIQLLKTQQNFTKKIRRSRSKEWLGMEADALQNPHKGTNKTGKTAYTIPVPLGGSLLSRVALGFASAISVCHDISISITMTVDGTNVWIDGIPTQTGYFEMTPNCDG
jgi:hypothetical protein